MRIAEIGAGAVVTVVAAGVPRKPGEARLELVRRNAAILLQDAPRVVQHIPAGILPVAANPVAALAGLACDWAAMEEIPRDQSTALSVSTRIRGVVPSGGRGGHAQRRQPGYEGHRP